MENCVRANVFSILRNNQGGGGGGGGVVVVLIMTIGIATN